jgi:uncharacterized phage protein (TIGR01671 family)
MTREIKFRAWDKEKNIMGEVSCLSYPNRISGKKQTVNFWYKDTEFWYKDTEYRGYADSTIVLMQYTGLKDKNGKEIYEGDIVKKNNSANHRCKPNKECGTFEIIWEKEHAGFNMTGDRSHVCEVIGNIYQNPELLTNKQ